MKWTSLGGGKMPFELDDAERAGRLLRWGLQPRSRPAQEPEYQELLERYLNRREFRQLVQEFARGLELVILSAEEHGIVLGPAQDSVFALKPADFRSQPSADDRLLDGLVQLAIAATVFPRARDLEQDPSYAKPPVTIVEVEENLRQLCKHIEEEHQGNPDPLASDEHSGLNDAWRIYQRRLAVMETRDGHKSQRTTQRIIEFGLDRLRDFGCFTKENQNGQVVFQPTWRYQVLVKELAATSAYEAVRHMMQAPKAPAFSEID